MIVCRHCGAQREEPEGACVYCGGEAWSEAPGADAGEAIGWVPDEAAGGPPVPAGYLPIEEPPPGPLTASLGRRLLAFLVDCLLYALFAGAYFGLLGVLTRAGAGSGFRQIAGLVFLGLTVMLPVIAAICDASFWMGTPGKRLLKIAVANPEGDRLSVGRALARHVLRLLSLPFVWPPLGALFSRRRRTFHDWAVNSIVLAPSEAAGRARPYTWQGAARTALAVVLLVGFPTWLYSKSAPVGALTWVALGVALQGVGLSVLPKRRARLVGAAGLGIAALILFLSFKHARFLRACDRTMRQAARNAGCPVMFDGVMRKPPKETTAPSEPTMPGKLGPEETPLPGPPPRILYPEGDPTSSVFPPVRGGRFALNQDVPETRAPSRLPIGGPVYAAYNANLGRFPVKLPNQRTSTLIVLAEAKRAQFDKPEDLVYRHGGRALVMTDDGALCLVTRKQAKALRFVHRDDLWAETQEGLFSVADIPKDRQAAKERLSLKLSAPSNFASPLVTEGEGPVKLICQFSPIGAAATKRAQVRGDFTDKRPHLGNLRVALRLPEDCTYHFAADDGSPSDEPTARVFFLKVGPFARVDCILDPTDQVTVCSFFADTIAARHATDGINDGSWHRRVAAEAWIKAATGLSSGEVAPQRSAIKGAQHVGYIIHRNAPDLGDYSLTRYNSGDYYFRGDPAGELDLVVVVDRYSRTLVGRSGWYGGGGGGGRITYYRNSARMMVLDAANPSKVLFCRNLSASPTWEGPVIFRYSGWSGEDQDGSSELSGKISSTYRGLGLP